MEVAAGAVIAEEVVSTTVQASAVAVAIAQPTGPLKAVFHQIGSAPQSGSPDSLARSSHSVTALDGDLYVYGGSVAKSTLAGPEMHILKLSNVGGSGADYKSIPPLAENESDPTPGARAGHAALSPSGGPLKGKIVLFGGYDEPNNQQPIDEGSRVWIFDPATMFWTYIDPSPSSASPESRANVAMVAWKNTIIIHGGKPKPSSSTPDTEPVAVDTWQLDLDTKTWTELSSLSDEVKLQSSENTASPPLFTISDDKLWLVTSPPDNLSTTVHFFDLAAWHKTTTQNPSDMASGEESTSWITLSIPTNPLTPGPSLRSGARVETISTGLGRRYLLLMLGTTDSNSDSSSPNDTSPYLSTLWSLQLPSSYTTPAAAKDATREALPKSSSHTLEWHAVDVIPKDEAPVGSQQQTWLGSARSGVQGFLSTNVGGAASWVRHKASVAGLKAADLAGANKSSPASPADAVEGEPGPVLEDAEAKQHADDGAASSAQATTPTVQTVPPVPIADEDGGGDGSSSNVRSGEPTSGKAHPGPRGYFGSAVLQTPWAGVGLSGPSETGAHILLWGGVNARGDREGDGWLVEVKV